MAKKKPSDTTASLNIQEFDVHYLLEHKAEYNPRTIGDESRAGLSLSIDKFKYVDPIIFNTRTERIVSGHQRLDLLAEKGYTRVQVNTVDLPENLEKELNIAMNARTITGEFTSEVNEIISSILESDVEFFDMLNLGTLEVGDDYAEEDGGATGQKSKCDVPGMDLLPYEHYDCLLVVFKNVDDWLYICSQLHLDERRIISAPCVKNKKIGKVRAISADKIVKLIKSGSEEDDFDLPDLDLADGGPDVE
ncbi:MAG: hypothetical protein PHI85_05080 [Victivallaceae bacterium]|nr:hypothetical protein [Victivallaceae bacterium]